LCVAPESTNAEPLLQPFGVLNEMGTLKCKCEGIEVEVEVEVNVAVDAEIGVSLRQVSVYRIENGLEEVKRPSGDDLEGLWVTLDPVRFPKRFRRGGRFRRMLLGTLLLLLGRHNLSGDGLPFHSIGRVLVLVSVVFRLQSGEVGISPRVVLWLKLSWRGVWSGFCAFAGSWQRLVPLAWILRGPRTAMARARVSVELQGYAVCRCTVVGWVATWE